jgi:hypothetical protein
MKSAVAIAVGVAVASALASKPIARLKSPASGDKIRLAAAVVVTAASVALAFWAGIPAAPAPATGGAFCGMDRTVYVRNLPDLQPKTGLYGGGDYSPYRAPEGLEVVASPRIPPPPPFPAF